MALEQERSDTQWCPYCERHVPLAMHVHKYRTVYRRQRDLDRHPDVDPARLPLTVYSSSDNHNFAREDLAYLQDEGEGHDGVAHAWIETRIEHPWERTDEWEPPPDPRVPEEAWPEWLFYVLMGTIVAGVTFALVAALVWQ